MSPKWVLVFLFCFGASDISLAAKAWWQTASFYQIYPRSFKDSDGDGIGDLKGVTDSLAYLKEIGIAATWLSPFLESPMADFGYDISNFTKVDPLFGTMEDFDELMAKSKKLGVRIILDFVPNHSSNECEWFIKSAAKDPEYKDFYVWHPGKIENGVRSPPNNWVSVFRGSAWEWHEGRQEYFLHQFHKKQPDFNFRNPQVRETMNEILRFWLRKGIDGFRVDAIHHGFEIAPDADGNYPDEPRNDWNNDPEDYGYVDHIYTVDQPETPHLVYEWRKVLDDFQKENGGDERILMVEAWSPIDTMMHYYGNDTAEGAQIPFNFQMISYLWSGSDAYHYAELINAWLDRMPAGRSANWVIGNHDKNRVGSRFGSERIDLFNILLLTLPGCSITYNGEEIGMTDVWISWNDTVDPQACNGFEDGYEYRSRDPARTPFQWSDAKHAGFSTGETTWLPVGTDYELVNVKRQRGITFSHLNVFKQLQVLRSEKVLQDGNAEVKAVNSNVLGVKRYLYGEQVYIVLLNVFEHVQYINLDDSFKGIPNELEYILVNDKSPRRKGDFTSVKSITLMPHEVVVLRSVEKIYTFSFL
ncbi:maltase A3-like [Teleopsis dalmanni]|uniref:maltase A3-like n=1 Tax=Teleopsis dalmanni TaxID=139649 RepID=UPI0018CCD646|nr:maltase A3-like [Teleopsis dalmanni]